MKRIILNVLCICLAALLTACGGDDTASQTGTASQAADAGAERATKSNDQPVKQSGRLFDKKNLKPCELLDADSVAAVAGVDVASVEQMEMASMCLYSWEGGSASMGMIRVSKTVESARSSFENSYRSMSRQEVAEGMAKINEQIEKKSEAGETDVDPEAAKTVTGAMAGAFAGGLQFEDIEGLGDLARFETTRSEVKVGTMTIVSYANSMNVLVGNMKFTVTFNRDEEVRLYRDENIDLARAVLERL